MKFFVKFQPAIWTDPTIDYVVVDAEDEGEARRKVKEQYPNDLIQLVSSDLYFTMPGTRVV